MDPLFEAKVYVEDQYALYHIYRLDRQQYRAQLVVDKNGDYATAAPTELIVSKNNGRWETNPGEFNHLGSTLGVEIDVFNNGYGERFH